MQRNFLRGFLICLVPCLLAAAFALRLDKYKLGIDLAGGTILVYEVNLERTKQLHDARRDQGEAPSSRQQAAPAEGLSSEDMHKLASQIKRRIDPADLKNVTVRPLGNSRVEIILPTGGSGGGRSNLSAEEIEEVKRLVSQMGVLEFRILANQADDDAGIRAARELIDSASPDDLTRWAVAGTPPPPPAEDFEVKAAGETPVKVRYAWVELGPEERESLGLNNAAEATSRTWTEAAASRNKTFTRTFTSEDGSKQSVCLFFSREVKTPAWLEKEAKDKARLEAEGKADQFNPKKYEYFVLTRISSADTVKVEGDISLTAQSDTDKGLNPCVSFRFNGPGAQAFGRMTERNKPAGTNIRVLAILLDERVVSAPTLNAVITSAGQITGKFDRKSVERLVNFLRNGALNAQLREKPVSENTIGPTLGADTIRKGTEAVGLAFAVVLAFMIFYYRFAGLVACVALLANLLLTVGFMVAVNAAFTLPGLAGVVLMLGMAVDANVLIYERLREERNKGANLATAIRNGYDRAFFTIIDTHLTSIFTAIVLYTFGNDQLKGFAISLTVGLVISLFTSLYMTRLMFDFWLHKRWLTELRMLRLFERPSFNPMKYRFYFFSITSVLTVLGLGLFLFRGEAGMNVDFRGGTVYAGQMVEGQERALTTTSDRKLGLRDLLGEERQKERLNVETVRWVNAPANLPADPVAQETVLAAVGTYIFEITYSDKAATTVGLSQKPDGKTVNDIEDAVKARARHLPDVSVEQMFLSGENYGEGKSRYFTVRTTERQPDLVRASLDRLLRDDDGKPLVASTHVTIGPVTGPVVELTFDRPMSPSQMRDLLDREFRKENAVDPAGASFDLRTPPADQGENGRYKVMWLDVSKNTTFAALKKKEAAAASGGTAGAAVGGWPTAVAAATALADKDLDDQARTLQAILHKTKLAVETRPEPERLEVFDSQLASETRTKAFYAILASWAAILLYLWFRFGNWTFGLAAVLCLVHDLCFTLGAIAACHYLFDNPFGYLLRLEDFKIDLPTVAALLTLVGYSVNEIIVNFARIREVRGKNPVLTPQMINDSVNQTLSRTILTSMTVFLVSFVLYAFGGEGVHLFAFVMVMGVMVSTYSSIFIASPLLLFLGEGHGTVTTEAPKVEEEAAIEG
ncbi:MAG: secD [Gemmataceae bacterium]|nr:secD [Gemmataceae bacterium]